MSRPSKKAAKAKVTTTSRMNTAAAIGRTFAPTLVAAPFIVDAHCHTFNASDLSTVGFLKDVLLDSDESIIRKLAESFAVVLVKLVTGAPGFQEELDHLHAFQASKALRASAEFVQTHADEREATDQQFWGEVADEMRRISLSSNGQERALFQAIVDEVHPGGMRALASTADAASADALAQRIAFSSGPFSRYVQWVARLKHYRADIIAEIIQTYGREPDGVRLFVSALVDFEYWVKDSPHTPIIKQVELGARLAAAFPGRIHFFAPYDPWREVAHGANEESSLELVKKAVMEDGFIGVKLYPPMGFAAADNATLDFSAVDVDDPAFGASLDAALDALFAWAVAQDVPIMAHCNLSEESKHGFALRASPAFWADALVKHPGLRLNLGHFGGQNNLGPGGVDGAADWPEAIIALMCTKEGANVYTDVANFDMGNTAWFGILKTALTDKPVLLSRLMYGSDWMMLALSNHYEEFLSLFRSGLASLKTLTDSQVADILGGNAKSFLGLNAGDRTRSRLLQFYAANSITLPPWLQ